MTDDETKKAEQLGHESWAVNARAVSIAAAVLFGGIVVAILLMAGLSVVLSAVRGGMPRVRPAGAAMEPPPGVPEVDANQMRTLQRLRAEEKQVLTEYAWIDREQGVARIPVERAMEILAGRSALDDESSND